MKLIKIGSSPSCDIVLNSQYVSGHHADILVLDNGDIILEDKNSTNGTTVGGKRIKPNVEVPVRQGDQIYFADAPLAWSRIPMAPNNSKYKTVVNIGSDYRNDIVVSNPTVSRFHASLKIEKKGGKALLFDNGSANGIKVNGIQMTKGTPKQIKKGDNIICGTEDVTETISQFLPNSVSFLKIAMSFLLVACLVGGAYWMYNVIIKDDPSAYRPSVVYVQAKYHYEVSLEDNPFNDQLKKAMVMEVPVEGVVQATAFFIDNEGRMATNRHVALPWSEEYRSGEYSTENLTQKYEEFLAKQLKIKRLDTEYEDLDLVKAVTQLQSTALGKELLESCSNETELNAKLNRINKSKLKIVGVMDRIMVGYPGNYYTHLEEFQFCNVSAVSNDPKKDVAILQLNDKKTPKTIEKILHIDNISTESLRPLKDDLYYIGYPYGILWGMDDDTKSLEPNLRKTTCTKNPGKYDFEFDAASVGGSSGSPLFNKKGQLVGILYGGYSNHSVTFAVHAKYLKQLYDQEVRQ